MLIKLFVHNNLITNKAEILERFGIELSKVVR